MIGPGVQLMTHSPLLRDCISGRRCHSLSDFIGSRTHSLFGLGLGNGMGEETPTAICFIPCVAPATEGVTRKAAIGSLDAAGEPLVTIEWKQMFGAK